MAKFIRYVMLALLTLSCCWPLPVQAASSAAIRAYDDAEISSKSFADQNLQQVEFSDVHLDAADFSRADLRGIVFNSATLKDANLQAVDMTDGLAYLSDFKGADLSNAILNSAILLKSNFRNAKVTGADFTDAVLDKDQILALCQSASGINPRTGVDTRESLGCR